MPAIVPMAMSSGVKRCLVSGFIKREDVRCEKEDVRGKMYDVRGKMYDVRGKMYDV